LLDAIQSVEPRTISKEFVFTGDRLAMTAARDSVMDFLGDYVDGEQQEIDVLLALQEALANAVLHGSGGDPSKTIHCRVEIDPSAITIVVTDSGPGFDLAAVDARGANLSEHGRGISLMRGLMDEVSYSRGGSEVRLTKFRKTKP